MASFSFFLQKMCAPAGLLVCLFLVQLNELCNQLLCQHTGHQVVLCVNQQQIDLGAFAVALIGQQAGLDVVRLQRLLLDSAISFFASS